MAAATPSRSTPRPVEVAVVVADGDIPERVALDAAWPGWLATPHLVVAADGGAAGAEALGLRVDVLVGDLDSIEPARRAALEAAGTAVERWPRDKEASDTELAIRTALRHAPHRLVVLGAVGGERLDHALANLGLLFLGELGAAEVAILDARSRTRGLRGPAEIVLEGPVGDLVSLLPAGGPVSGVETDGLAFPLAGETLEAGSTRGLSNERVAPLAHVRLRSGSLLVIETHPGTEAQR